MKKIVSVLIVLAMLLTLVPMAFAAQAGTIEAKKGTQYTTDTWTATEAGVLTITLSSAEGVGYQVYCNGEALSLLWTQTYADTVSYAVNAGDEYYVAVKGWNPDSWAFCDATIQYSYDFSAGGALKEAYKISELVISNEGDHNVEMIDTAEVTIVSFTPDEVGVYTITVGEDALIGNYGGGDWYIYDRANVEHATSLEWTCETAGYWETVDVYNDATGSYSSVEQYISGQSLMLGIISDSETVNVNVEKTGEYTAATTVTVAYENKAALTKFAVPADATIGSYVDVYGDTHTAVLGDDGYYHLDSAKGDMLLVDMDYTFKLSSALASERPVMYAYVTDGEGNTTRYDIADAVLAYEAVCDENGYYPLTEDLIFFYDTYASGSGVLDYCLGSSYNPDCGWMFACLTMALPAGEEEVQEGSGTEEDPYIITSLPVDLSMTVPGGGGEGQVYYLYVAEQDGTIEIKDQYDNLYTGSIWIYVNDGDAIWLNEGGIGTVAKGDSVLIEHYQSNWMPNPITYEVTLQFAESTGGDNTGDDNTGDDNTGDDNTGDDNTGDAGEDSFAASETVFVPAGEEIVVEFTAAEDGVLTVELSTEDGWELFIRDSEGDFDAAYWSALGVTSPVTENITGGATYTITIRGTKVDDDWTYVDTTITYSITYTSNTESGSDVEVVGVLADGDNLIEMPVTVDTVSYSYTASETGTLYIMVPYVGLDFNGSGEYSDDTGDIDNDFNEFTSLTVNGTPLMYGYYGTVEVVAGETYIFTWTDLIEYFDWGWEATLNLAYSDENYPVIGSEDYPVKLTMAECPTESIEIAGRSKVYYELADFYGANFLIEGKNAYAIVSGYTWDQKTGERVPFTVQYDAVDGVVTVPVSSSNAIVQVCNSGYLPATFGLNYGYPLGSYENPDELTLGKNKVELAEGNEEGYLFTWVAESDGVLTIAVDGAYWQYSVTNYGSDMEDYEGDTYGDWHLWADDPVVASETWTVKAGDIIVVTVGAYDPVSYTNVADTVTVTASFVSDEAPDVVLGDVNDDGKIDTVDAFFIVAYYNKVRTLTDDQLAAADVDKNGRVDTVDAYYIVALYNKVIPVLPGAK